MIIIISDYAWWNIPGFLLAAHVCRPQMGLFWIPVIVLTYVSGVGYMLLMQGSPLGAFGYSEQSSTLPFLHGVESSQGGKDLRQRANGNLCLHQAEPAWNTRSGVLS